MNLFFKNTQSKDNKKLKEKMRDEITEDRNKFKEHEEKLHAELHKSLQDVMKKNEELLNHHNFKEKNEIGATVDLDGVTYIQIYTNLCSCKIDEIFHRKSSFKGTLGNFDLHRINMKRFSMYKIWKVLQQQRDSHLNCNRNRNN